MQQVIWRIPIPWDAFPNGIPLYGFGLMLFFAFLSASWFSTRRAKDRGIPPDVVSDLTIFLFVGGIVGARILFLSHLPAKSLMEYVTEFFKIWQGGIILYGALGGGFLAYLLFWFFVCRPKKINPLVLADVVAPPLALGIALGRIGCLLNGCCFGMVATPECPCASIHFPYPSPPRFELVREGVQSSLGFTWPTDLLNMPPVVGKVDRESAAEQAGLKPGDRIQKVGNTEVTSILEAEEALTMGWPEGLNVVSLTVQRGDSGPLELQFIPRTIGLVPAQLYETVSMILLVLLLLSAEGYCLSKPGQTITFFMMGYALHRGLNELLRNDPRPVGLERNTSLFMFLAGLILFVYFSMKKDSKKAAGFQDN